MAAPSGRKFVKRYEYLLIYIAIVVTLVLFLLVIGEA